MTTDTTGGTSSASRKIRRLGIAVVIVVALYSAGWFYLASKIEATAREFIARPGAVTIQCDDLARVGTPFRIGLSCSHTGVKDTRTGSMVSAGAIHTVANIYNPGTALVELDGPANVSLLDGTAITANWSLLHSGLSVGFSGLKTLSTTGENLSFDVFDYSMIEPLVAKAGHGEFHIRANGTDLETAVLAQNFSLALKSGAELLPTISTSTELTLKDKAELLSGKPLTSKAMTGQLTSFKIGMENGLFGEMTGPFEIDDEGYISGKFKTRLEKISLWQQNLVKIFPDAGTTISSMAALLKGFAKGGDDVTVNLVVNKGRISLSLIPLGEIPPI